MNLIDEISQKIIEIIAQALTVSAEDRSRIFITVNHDKKPTFGDLSCNAAMILAKKQKTSPRHLAQEIKQTLETNENLAPWLNKINIAGPGFINIFLKHAAWQMFSTQLLTHKQECFKTKGKNHNFLLEFVSANPTGPLHLGHGRGAIIGDVLANVLSFLGHSITKEYYINNTGSQIEKLGLSLKARYKQELGIDEPLPQDGYSGEYLKEIAQELVAEYKQDLLKQKDAFFEGYATKQLLKLIKKSLHDYGITFDTWFFENTLHEDGSVNRALALLQEKNLTYERDGALWFKSTAFGDDKDRVLKKQDGSFTYIATDIAYHKHKFDRGHDRLIDILGQDHHGYVMRLKGTIKALGYPADDLHVILYQLVSIKKGTQAVKMSKRAGAFTTLHEIIDLVGKDVARFFYLNRKAEAHLDFDLDVARKKTEENPVFYIQYAFVRIKSILAKAAREEELANVLSSTPTEKEYVVYLQEIGASEITLLKKIATLPSLLQAIRHTYHTHLLSYYAWELASLFHNYYAGQRIIDLKTMPLTKSRLLIARMVGDTIGFCLDLLGLSKPETM